MLGNPANSIAAGVAVKRLDVGWFDQAWFAVHYSSISTTHVTAYALRNVRSGSMCLSVTSLVYLATYLRCGTLAYLQAGKKLADGSVELEMTTRVPPEGPSGRSQTWYITNDGGFAR